MRHEDVFEMRIRRRAESGIVHISSMEVNEMNIAKKNIALLVSLMPIFLMLSCSGDREQARTVTQPGPLERQNNEAIANRFREPTQQGTTAVESAIELSEKYAKN